MTEPVLLENKSGRIATLTMNRPDRLNALSSDMIVSVIEAFTRLDKDESVGAIVLTGAGRGFCAGGDVKAMSQGTPQTRDDRIKHLRRAHQVPLLIRQCSKVVIGMINGPATGAGLGIANVCDIRIAGRSARFGAAFGKVGLAGDFGISWSLTKLVGASMARYLLLSAEMIDADRAFELGLVNQVVDDAKLAEAVRDAALQYAEGPSIAYSLMKKNLFAAETQSFEEVLDLEAENQATVLQTADHREAVSAFIEKRKAAFAGR